jgi:SAM-dependent methyltransferase
MIPFQLLRRIPLVRRSFYRRDMARTELAALAERLADIERERDELKAGSQSLSQWRGWCPICEAPAVFRAEQSWFRDHLICQSCPNGSIPRERAIMQALRFARPGWQTLQIHESSPLMRGTSFVLARDCPGYIPSYFWPDVPCGSQRNGVRCENIEQQTFPDASFDVVITQDVMEHLFHPEWAVAEIHRTLRQGGLYLFTAPVYNDLSATVPYAILQGDRIVHLQEPEYHGNPVNDKGSLVTFHYAHDLERNLSTWAEFQVEMIESEDYRLGIVGEFLHVFICRKA